MKRQASFVSGFSELVQYQLEYLTTDDTILYPTPIFIYYSPKGSPLNQEEYIEMIFGVKKASMIGYNK